jgi:hypothetical protein
MVNFLISQGTVYATCKVNILLEYHKESKAFLSHGSHRITAVTEIGADESVETAGQRSLCGVCESDVKKASLGGWEAYF